MAFLIYCLAFPLLWLISRLPFWLLYTISDGVYILLYRIIGYRKNVVRSNLRLVFPEKTENELLQIEKKFYRHLCDMFLEMAKTMGISVKEIEKRFSFTNLEVIHELEKQKKNILLLTPHYASWEWIMSLNTQVSSNGYAVYLKIENPYFDKLVKSIRSRFGTTLWRTVETRKNLANAIANKEQLILGIAGDQSPQLSRARHWADYMGITVPVHIGGEELAKTYDLTPIFLQVRKLKRGYYQTTFKVITKNPKSLPDYEITENYLKESENLIKEAPEFYFWTHKRWKHRNKVPDKYKK